jgi:epoxide hydrolase-like predicted phosphatase
MTRAIIFDFGNVLCRFEPQRFVERLFRHAKRPIGNPQEALQHSSDLGRDYETGVITSDQFFDGICDRFGLVVDKKEFIDAFVHIFTPIPSTFNLIRQLKPRYALGLLSNTNEWHFEYGIKPVEVYPLFDAVTVSFQVGAMKPDERMYRDILEKLGIEPDEAVYIDDLKDNVEAGRNFGMMAIHYISPEQCLMELRRRDVAV